MELKKLKKIMVKLEKRYDVVGPVEKKRISKKSRSIQKKIDVLTA